MREDIYHLTIRETPFCLCPHNDITDGIVCGHRGRESAEKAVEILRERYADAGEVLPDICIVKGGCPAASEAFTRTYGFAESLTTEEIFKCIFDDMEMLRKGEWEPDEDSIEATCELLTELQRRVCG